MSRFCRSILSRHILALAYALLACAALGVSEPARAESKTQAGRYYEDAVKRFNKGEYEATIIQLKNALQEEPRMLPAMALMGETYVAMGKGAAAETALSEATKAGADVALTAVPLAKAYLLQFKQDILLAEPMPPGLPLMKRAELLEVKAGAALQINDMTALRRILDEVDRIDPESVATLSLRATVALRNGEYAEAERYADRALRANPASAVAWLTRASLDHARGDIEQALQGYAKVLELDPKNSDARLARVGLMLDLRRDAETDQDFLALSAEGALDPRVAYLRAVKLARAGDAHGMRSSLNEAAVLIDALGKRIVARNSQLLMLAGVVNFALGNMEVARGYLEEYVKTAGGESATRTMLAEIMLQQKEYQSAARLLEELGEDAVKTPQHLTMQARAYTGMGEHHRAAAALEQATALSPGNPTLATNLALARARRGQIDVALADLAKVFSQDESQRAVGMPLAILHLNRNDYASAVDVARRLHAQEPQNLTVMNLLAVALIGQGELNEARVLLDKALALDPGFVAADINLGKLDRRAGEFAAAESRFGRLLLARPADAQIMLELARTARVRGDRDTALKWARDASKANPNSFEMARYLIDLYLEAGDLERAGELIFEQTRLYPDNLFVMEMQSRVFAAQGQKDAARPILRRMVDRAQFDGDWLIKIAGLQTDLALFDDAQYTLYKLVQDKPGDSDARARLAAVELALGNIDAGAEHAQRLVRDFPRQPDGYALLGDALVARGQQESAAEQFRLAQEFAPGPWPEIALKQHLALRRAGDDRAAEAVLRNWLALHPDDPWAKGALAEHAMHTGQFDTARTLFEDFLRAAPDHTPTMNNLANVLVKLGDLQGALALARQAQELVPTEPMFNDTLGWILVLAGETDQGLRFLREARTRAALVPEISYHLAVALHRQGRVDEARVELRNALKDDGYFDGKLDAQRLQQELGG